MNKEIQKFKDAILCLAESMDDNGWSFDAIKKIFNEPENPMKESWKSDEWEDEYYKRFLPCPICGWSAPNSCGECKCGYEDNHWKKVEEVKQFISSLLQKQREELLDKVNTIILNNSHVKHSGFQDYLQSNTDKIIEELYNLFNLK